MFPSPSDRFIAAFSDDLLRVLGLSRRFPRQAIEDKLVTDAKVGDVRVESSLLLSGPDGEEEPVTVLSDIVFCPHYRTAFERYERVQRLASLLGQEEGVVEERLGDAGL